MIKCRYNLKNQGQYQSDPVYPGREIEDLQNISDGFHILPSIALAVLFMSTVTIGITPNVYAPNHRKTRSRIVLIKFYAFISVIIPQCFSFTYGFK
ncbi:hypothetical protein D4M60_16040 [Klebsiella pneumoniae]|nr:hypothetical protein AL478_001485 [Klebsiella pneumoniae]RWT54778.1 hypothetical protein DN601_25385 [Klebsiella quasipneumoniae subsp. similipneumoniae]TXW09333.1 hypothetical protein D4M60_16040 [Klebsiella pneumoniae]